MHLQPASKEFGYSKGDFPLAEKICQEVPPLQQITVDHNVLCHFAGATHLEKN